MTYKILIIDDDIELCNLLKQCLENEGYDIKTMHTGHDAITVLYQKTDLVIPDVMLPEYETKTGRKKKRESVIGILHGSKNTLTGIVDVAMVGSIYNKGKFNELINSYGMVKMDECHHATSNTSMELCRRLMQNMYMVYQLRLKEAIAWTKSYI